MIEHLKAQRFVLASELNHASGFVLNTQLTVRCDVLRKMIADIDAEIEELESQSASEEVILLQKIADIAHKGGVLGFSTTSAALIEIRRLTIPYWKGES